jgi:hypothetical protein
MATLYAKSTPNGSHWTDRHNQAVADANNPNHKAFNATEKHSSALLHMLTAWKSYATAHEAQFEGKIGNDYVLGAAWQEIGEALRTLLNGELGGLDGGTVDGYILDTMKENGINTDNL